MIDQLKSILAAILVVAAIYLAGAFAFASFNLADWPPNPRASIALVALLACLAVYLMHRFFRP